MRARSGVAGDRPGDLAGDRPGGGTHGCRHLIDLEATAGVLDDEGWVTTGDFGLVDTDGNLRLAGRANELYVRGGYNVYPAEVEAVLASHPGVARAVVIGTPDDVLGEVGVAFVEPASPAAPPPSEELRNLCSARLADYKVPDAVVVIDVLPLTSMLKVDRRPLAAPARAAATEAAARRLAERR